MLQSVREFESAPARSRRIDEIAAALPQRAAALSRLFLTRTTIDVSLTEIGVIRACRFIPSG